MLGILKTDDYLKPYSGVIEKRHNDFLAVKKRIAGEGRLSEFALGHLYYGVHKVSNKLFFREWAPNATAIYLISDLTNWKPSEKYSFKKIINNDDWELVCDADDFPHQSLYKLYVKWEGGEGERIPSYAARVVQDNKTKIFSAQIWLPETQYQWNFPAPAGIDRDTPLLIYETHIGMAQEEGKIGSFDEFRENIVPIIAEAGYNAIQIMALMEHPYYGSFGYQVSNFFALSSRFGTPEEFKHLVDTCHEKGIKVLMDIVHSHSVKNVAEGLSEFDGTDYQYFHSGAKGIHPAWDSKLFDYGKIRVLHFLLSNCSFWLNEYKIDGFRFDGVTSMLYRDHGLAKNFTSYDDYFGSNYDSDAGIYLSLANSLIHEINPEAVTISEDMSGYPGIAAAISDGGLGFDYRLAMGIPDFWIKILKEKKDEQWSAHEIWHQLCNRRIDEKNIAYSESHDQALVGDKTIAFRLMDSQMYTSMRIDSNNITIERGIALHKIIRLLTFSAGGEAYLNFMGNEFGHPEWIDFPREGNNWSYQYARRQWSLLKDNSLRYSHMAEFDKAMLENCKPALLKGPAKALRIDENDQVIVFIRGNLLFAVNFNPVTSYTDYEICTDNGKYKLVLNSDSPAYGGFARVPDYLVLDAVKRDNRVVISPYLPSRTALVFKKTGG